MGIRTPQITVEEKEMINITIMNDFMSIKSLQLTSWNLKERLKNISRISDQINENKFRKMPRERINQKKS